MAMLAGCGGAEGTITSQSSTSASSPSRPDVAAVEASWGPKPDQPSVDRFDSGWCSNRDSGCELGIEITDVGDENARLFRAEPFTSGEFGARSVAHVWLWTAVDGVGEPQTSDVDEELLSIYLSESDNGLTYSRIVSDDGFASEGEQLPPTWFFSSKVGPWTIDGLERRLASVDARARAARDSVVALTLPPAIGLGHGAQWIVTGELGVAESVVASIKVEVLSVGEGSATVSFSGRIEWVEPFMDRGESFFGGWEVAGTATWFENSPVPSAVFELVGETEFEAVERLDDLDAPRVVISERRLMSIEPAPPG